MKAFNVLMQIVRIVTTGIENVKHQSYVAKGEGEDNHPSPATIRRHEFWFLGRLATGLLSLGALVLGTHFPALHVVLTVSSVSQICNP